LIQEVQGETEPDQDMPRVTGGSNTIYYGAPGTGKSYTVNQETKGAGPARVVRTVFHPDTQNADFIGSLKPVVRTDGDIGYRFSPGPFAKALSEAFRDPGNMHWLVIEELNRAPAAAVFGELFQLLDRDDDGAGEYEVNFPSDEFADWWESQTGSKNAKLRLLSNLSISATMNSADQGVFPLDTAFRRRWNQEYIALDYTTAPSGTVEVHTSASDTETIEWRVFVSTLNDFLATEIGAGISEDRLVGQRFLSPSELGSALPGKLLIYLWDDLLRHHGREILFRAGVKTYGELTARQSQGKPIFSDQFLAAIGGEQATDE